MHWQLRLRWLPTIFLVFASAASLMAQSDSQSDVKSLASDMERRVASCPRREIVARFDGKHHKQVWQKQAWGPPTDVFADAKANDESSLLYPYVLILEFSLKMTFGPKRESKADAAKDSELSEPEGIPAWLLTSRYRNTYLAGKGGTRLKKSEALDRKLDGSASEWKERAPWPDACWDQVAIKE